jgi:hypothetical protein
MHCTEHIFQREVHAQGKNCLYWMLPEDLIPEGSVLFTVRKEQFKFKREEFIKLYVVIINMVYIYNLKICFTR